MTTQTTHLTPERLKEAIEWEQRDEQRWERMADQAEAKGDAAKARQYRRSAAFTRIKIENLKK